jgi:sugar phosphate isomerase/epimerase
MKRRDFLKFASGRVAIATLTFPSLTEATALSRAAFTPCINQATTMKADFKTAMDAYSKAGFRAVELWLASIQPFLEKESTAVARRVLADHGLEPVSSCCQADLFFPRVSDRDKKLDEFRRKLDLSAQLGAKRFVMFSAVSERVAPEDYVAAVPRLREIGELGRRFDIVVGIEFIRSAKFLGCLETTSKLLREAAHPNLGVLLDTFHFYAGISKIADIVKLHGGEISFVHIDDVPAMPRELLEDKHRVFVGDGVLPLEEILRALAKVYQGPLSFEVFQYADQDPYAVAIKAFDGLARLLAGLEKDRKQ